MAGSQGLIYCVTNQVNGKKYVGQTVRGSWYVRWKQHMWSAESGSPLPIHAAIRKYGKANFKVMVLWECSDLDELNQMEEFYARDLGTYTPSGYNIKAGNQLHHKPSLGRQCMVVGCTRKYSTMGYCHVHYVKFRSEGKTGLPPCSVGGCGGSATSCGYCHLHYMRLKSHGSTDLAKPIKRCKGLGVIDRSQLQSLYVDDGLSIRDISDRTGCSRWVISEMLKYYGIPTKPVGFPEYVVSKGRPRKMALSGV